MVPTVFELLFYMLHVLYVIWMHSTHDTLHSMVALVFGMWVEFFRAISLLWFASIIGIIIKTEKISHIIWIKMYKYIWHLSIQSIFAWKIMICIFIQLTNGLIDLKSHKDPEPRTRSSSIRSFNVKSHR